MRPELVVNYNSGHFTTRRHRSSEVGQLSEGAKPRTGDMHFKGPACPFHHTFVAYKMIRLYLAY